MIQRTRAKGRRYLQGEAAINLLRHPQPRALSLPKPWYNCTINNVGPAADAGPRLVVYINLTDEGGAFVNRWFFAADNSKSEMLAVALTAVSLGATVLVATADPPDEYTQISRIYINPV
jgi:hypothetical protein